MCLLTLGCSPCNHSDCQSPCEPPCGQSVPTIPSSLLASTLDEVNQLLCQVAEQNFVLQNHVQILKKYFAKSHSTGCVRMEPPIVKGHLELAVPAPSQVFKEKGFPLTVRVMSAPGVPCMISGLHFRVQLYSDDSPPTKVTVNISGKKVLRGSIDAYSDNEGVVHFPNIVINEVSSHYLNNCFSLVVSQSGEQHVQAFVLPRLIVKARKQGKVSYKTSIEDIDDLAMTQGI